MTAVAALATALEMPREELLPALRRLGEWLGVALLALAVLWLLAHRLAALAAWVAIRLGDHEPVGSPTTGREGMIGCRGVARTPLAPAGKVFVRGELWHAVADEPVAAEDTVEVVDMDGLTLRVRPQPNAEGGP